MKLAWSRFGLPLLMKELYEQAARRRTYVVRVVYASLLFLFGLLLYYSTVGGRSSDPFALLGYGRQFFITIVMMQFMGIYLFMPAMTCGVVTSEKERNSLGLLFLTRLGPWAILLEKYLSRVIPMLSFLLLSLPLLVIAYSLGGLTQAFLWAGIWLLLVSVLQVGAIALFCSAFFRSTTSAFIATYLIGIVVMFGPIFCQEVLDVPLNRLLNNLLGLYGVDIARGVAEWFLGPVMFQLCQGASVAVATAAGLPILFSAVFFLLLARAFVVRRAFLPPTYALLRIFRQLDRYFSRVNHNRLTRGIVLVRDPDPLYIVAPVAWRETTKAALGSTGHLIRMLLIIEIPVAVIVVLFASSHTTAGITVVLLFLWVLSVLVMAVKGASLISRERGNETLDVLLTTGLRGTEIVRQKASGLRRLNSVLAIPLLTIILFKFWMMSSTSGYGRPNGALYLICALLSVALYLPMVGWFSFWLGLRVRNQTRAIFSAVAGLAGWCILPFFATIIILQMVPGPDHELAMLMLLSPAPIIGLNEYHQLDSIARNEWLPVVLNFAFYGVCLFIFRTLCLRNAGRYLGRGED
jgi:hypothetical protein